MLVHVLFNIGMSNGINIAIVLITIDNMIFDLTFSNSIVNTLDNTICVVIIKNLIL